jgi:hypothetical protein
MSSKDELTENISNLKKDIQELINYKKENSKKLSNEEIVKIEKDKNEKIENLSKFTKMLKDIIKKEKERLSLINNIKKVQNINDSINYHYVKKYKNSEELENLKNNKEIRENTRQEYLHYLQLEEIFYKLDPENIPGILFLHQNIIETYGLCPFIIDDIDLINTISSEYEKIKKSLEEKRKKWLDNTPDNGKIYYDLMNTIFNENDLCNFKFNLKNIEDNLERIITNFLNNSQLNIYKDCLSMINEYINCKIKTKKIKEKYKLIIHNLSILYSESKLPIHKYLQIKYSINIPINAINNNLTDQSKNNDLINKSINNDLYIVKHFDDNIVNYNAQIEEILQKNKYVTNIKKNLKQDFHNFLMKKSKINSVIENKNILEGKYFKNWSNLTIDEKNERLEYFSKYYVENILKIHDEFKSSLISNLNTLLQENLNLKKLTCKHLNWKAKKGYIEKIKILHFDKENNLFELKATENCLVTEKSNEKLKKSLSKKSILEKNNDKIINEEMLKFILKYNQTFDSNNSTDFSNEFIEKIKIKLKLKKLSNDDKMKITKKLIDMKDIIKNNPSCI